MKVLFLTPWYPSETDAMAGLFVQKHMEAVQSQGADVRVLHSTGWKDMLHKWLQLKHEWGMPDIVQLNVIQKQGLLALWLKRHYHIPYIIVEHWSGYLPENGQYMRLSAIKKRFMRHVCRKADMVLTVSKVLQDAMQKAEFYAQRWDTIDNVVDSFFYQQSAIKNLSSDIQTLLHVSCFDERAKNVHGLLKGFKILAERRNDIRLVLIGTGVDWEENVGYARSLGLSKEQALFTGELSPVEVAQWMHQSHGLVISSRYETYCVVLAEAATAGIPFLSTPVGIAEEMIANGAKGIIVPHEVAQHNPKQFAQYMEEILQTTKWAKKDSLCFSAQHVGERLISTYESIIS